MNLRQSTYFFCQTAAKNPSVACRCGHRRRYSSPSDPPAHRLCSLRPHVSAANTSPTAMGSNRHGFAENAVGNGLVFLRPARCRWHTPDARQTSASALRCAGWPSAWSPFPQPPAAYWRHFRSGLRRKVPSPLQGASTKTRSILPARRLMRSSRSCAMATGCTLDRPLRANPRLELSQGGGRRCRTRTGGRCCALQRQLPSVLPPAPAQKSATISPRLASSSSASKLGALVLHLEVTAHKARRLLLSAGLPSMRRPQGE